MVCQSFKESSSFYLGKRLVFLERTTCWKLRDLGFSLNFATDYVLYQWAAEPLRSGRMVIPTIFSGLIFLFSYIHEKIVTQWHDSCKVMAIYFCVCATNDYFKLKINCCLFCLQLRAQNQVLKKGVVDEQANSAALKVCNRIFVLWD